MSTRTPKECRAGLKCQPQTTKEACDCLGHHSARSLSEMCELAQKSVNRMGKAFSLYDMDHFPRLDEIVLFTQLSADDPRDRNYVAVDFLCRQMGGAFVLLPRVQPADEEFFGAIASMLQHVSDLAAGLSESLRDKVIDDREQQGLRIRTHALQQKTAEIDAMVDSYVAAVPGALRAVKGA